MSFVDVPQNSVEWMKMRIGCTTASRMFDIVDRLKKNSANGKQGDYKQSRRNYAIELICERLCGRASDHFVNDWMIRGIEDEELAVAAYERYSNADIFSGGLFVHDSIEYFMASPDRRVGEKGLLELKNLKPENHYEILRAGQIPERFIWQMNAQLACAPEREWVDYGSYCKEMLAPQLRLFVRRHYRDRERVAEVEAEVIRFNAELAAELTAVAAMGEPVRVTQTR